MAKTKHIEASMAVAEAPVATSSYNDLFRKIDNLKGEDRLHFCKTLTTDEKKAYVSHCKDRDCEPVTGVFRCFEPLGGMLEMTAQAYHGEYPRKYTFYDDKEYTVPKYVAKRFENEFQGIGTWYPTHTNLLDKDGKPMVGVGKKNRRFGFNSSAI